MEPAGRSSESIWDVAGQSGLPGQPFQMRLPRSLEAERKPLPRQQERSKALANPGTAARGVLRGPWRLPLFGKCGWCHVLSQ